jgi:predicted protein tyrosine phosphatase
LTLIVCGLSEVERIIAQRRPSHLVTLLDPASMIETPAGLSADCHLRVGVNDIAEVVEGLVAPCESIVADLIAFARDWDETAPMLIHCWAGISRSTAAAFTIACERSAPGKEAEIAWAIRDAAPHAYPNRRIVALADDLLGRQGRMVDAVNAIGLGEYAVGFPFDLAARHE